MEHSEFKKKENSVPTAQIRPKARFSLIWIIPLTAALIGAWLLFKYYSERGTIIDITFNEAAGIEEKKTPIRYKNVIVGKVKKLGLTPDLNKVTVSAEIFPGMAENLGSNTRFWIVKPRVTLQGISGLDTLLSGVHIGIDPGTKSEPLEIYNGLSEPPYITSNKAGTRITLRTRSLGSLDVGSPIYYNKINVGEVTSYRLSPTTETIDVFIYVHEPYDKKIKSNTRFWNASGIEVELNSTGVSARMESLTSLLIGGISFETPRSGVSEEISGEQAFKLFESYKTAKDNTQRNNKLFYEMTFEDSLHGLSRDSTIEFSGVKVGKVERIRLIKSDDSSRIKAKVKVSLRIDKFSRKADAKEAEELLKDLVTDGMVAQLTVDSLITGAQYISLNIPKTRRLADRGKQEFILLPTSRKNSSGFPTTVAQTSLLNFDATEISEELNRTLASVTELVSSNDIKKILSGLASTTDSLSRISVQLDKEGFSEELIATLSNAKQAATDISKLMLDGSSTVGKLGGTVDSLQNDLNLSLKTFNNVANKMQKDISGTLKSFSQTSKTLDSGLKATLSEDSALQYRLKVLINDLSEASKSFSVLADTIQRKPNSVIFGK